MFLCVPGLFLSIEPTIPITRSMNFLVYLKWFHTQINVWNFYILIFYVCNNDNESENCCSGWNARAKKTKWEKGISMPLTNECIVCEEGWDAFEKKTSLCVMRAGKRLDTRSHFVIPMLLNPLILNSKILYKKEKKC